MSAGLRAMAPQERPQVSKESRELDARVQHYGAETICERLKPMLAPRRYARLVEVVSARLASVSVAIEHAYDPHNAAAVVRSADVFGVRDVHVIAASERVLRAKHTTRGVYQWMHTFGWRSIEGFAGALDNRGMEVLAAVPQGGLSIDDVEVTRPVCLLLGNEHSGLTAKALALSARRITVPMWGYSDSLNLSVCAALCLRTLTQRRRAVLGRSGDLDGLDYEHELARHLCIASDPRLLDVYFPMAAADADTPAGEHTPAGPVGPAAAGAAANVEDT